MPPLVLEQITQIRYLTDTKRAIIKWLRYHLNESGQFTSLWAKVRGNQVIVETSRTRRKATKHLPAPMVMLKKTDGEVVTTGRADNEYLYHGSYHRFTFELLVMTDGRTGRGVTADDVGSAIGKIFDEHFAELRDVGLTVTQFRDGDEEDDLEAGVYFNRCSFDCELYVWGAVRQTLALEVAHFAITVADGGDYTDGAELALTHELEIECLTRIRSAVDVTVYAINQVPEATTLTATIPANTPNQSKVALTPANVGDTFTDVTSIGIVGGLAGDIFRVLSIAQDV